MKQVISLFTFGIGALFFLAFFATLKPTAVTAASGPREPGYCDTTAPPPATTPSPPADGKDKPIRLVGPSFIPNNNTTTR